MIIETKTGARPVTDWRTAPVAGYNGPRDDEQLLSLMLQEAQFKHLWTISGWAVGESYGSREGAIATLAKKLAYYTGGDHQRCFELLGFSKLVEEAEKPLSMGALRAIVCKAVAETPEVFNTDASMSVKVHASAKTAAAHVTGPASIDEFEPGSYVKTKDQIRLWDGLVYVEDIGEIFIKNDGATIDKERFDIRYGGRLYQLDKNEEQASVSPWNCFTKSQVHDFPKVHAMRFSPRQAPGLISTHEGITSVNTYIPVDIRHLKGDASPFLNHLKTLFPNDYHILLAYMAAIKQNPGKKAAWCVFLQGVEGNGKSFVGQAMERCIGQRYTISPRSAEIDNKFNLGLYGKLLVLVEDISLPEAKDATWEALKPMITQERIELEGKNENKATREVCFNFILNSNHPDGIRKKKNDRRLCVLFAAQQQEEHLERDGLTEEYFVGLWDWAEKDGFAIIADYLQNYDIPEKLDFTKKCRRAPRTSSTDAAIKASLGFIEQEVLEAVENGDQGFAGDWISSVAFSNLLVRLGKDKYLANNRRSRLIESLGYAHHPALAANQGKTSTVLADGTRPRLYIKRGSAHTALNDSKSVVKQFEQDQRAALEANRHKSEVKTPTRYKGESNPPMADRWVPIQEEFEELED